MPKKKSQDTSVAQSAEEKDAEFVRLTKRIYHHWRSKVAERRRRRKEGKYDKDRMIVFPAPQYTFAISKAYLDALVAKNAIDELLYVGFLLNSSEKIQADYKTRQHPDTQKLRKVLQNVHATASEIAYAIDKVCKSLNIQSVEEKKKYPPMHTRNEYFYALDKTHFLTDKDPPQWRNNIADPDEPALSPDELVYITHGGGLFHIQAFLEGKSSGYKLESAGYGIQVTPVADRAGEKYDKQKQSADQTAEGYAYRSTEQFGDQPAVLHGYIKRKHLTAARNAYEGGVLYVNADHIINPVVIPIKPRPL